MKKKTKKSRRQRQRQSRRSTRQAIKNAIFYAPGDVAWFVADGNLTEI